MVAQPGRYPVVELRAVAQNIYVLGFTAPLIAGNIRAGQFLNIRAGEGCDPLLRRPFSVYHVEGDRVEIIFNIVGKGTAVLARSARGGMLDVLGPLGVPYHLEDNNFDTGVLMAGGLGIAPMPLATRALRAGGKKILTILGGRSSEQVLPEHLENVHIATDDGSRGFHGTVVDLAEKLLTELSPARPKLFACGPTAMLRAVSALAVRQNVPCEVSLEGAMACGIGICQGCPVELVGAEKKYALMCKDGPTFDVRTIKL
jgi:dihydroorotate dehydrogenase electron transfer subunit